MLTGEDLLGNFQYACTIYLAGDELSVVVLNTTEKAQKVLSMMSGFCAARFNYHLAAQNFDKAKEARVWLFAVGWRL